MAANTNPIFALKPETKVAIITGAQTDKSGATATNLVELLTAATDGTKVTRIKFKHIGNSAAGIGMVFITDTSGTTRHLHAETPVYSAVTSSSTVRTDEQELVFNDLQLKAGQKIFVGTTIFTTNIHVTAQIGEFS